MLLAPGPLQLDLDRVTPFHRALQRYGHDAHASAVLAARRAVAEELRFADDALRNVVDRARAVPVERGAQTQRTVVIAEERV